MRLGHMALGCRSQKRAGPWESKALDRRGLAAANDRVAYNGLSMRALHGIVCGVAHGIRNIRRHAGTPCPETCPSAFAAPLPLKHLDVPSERAGKFFMFGVAQTGSFAGTIFTKLQESSGILDGVASPLPKAAPLV
jgi:hypothetical protein